MTYDGREIGRAQGVQAEAARALPTVYMNPILLKPMMDCRSEVVLLGEVYRPMDGWNYHKEFTMEKGLEVMNRSLEELSKDVDDLPVVQVDLSRRTGPHRLLHAQHIPQ